MRDITVPDQSIRNGHFAKKQLFSPNRLISWSHRRRFLVGLRLAQQFAGKRVLDYGCGDGSFLAMLIQSRAHPAAAVGVEIDPEVVANCRARFNAEDGLSFVLATELEGPQYRAAFDAVICMEVLEHVVEIEPLLDNFTRLLAPEGLLLVSVPIETGPPLLVKQAVRRVAGWRGIGDYPGTSSYSLTELTASLFASGKRQHITRPVHMDPGGGPFHDHKGFNWMMLREMLCRKFCLEETKASPLAWLSPFLASQVWFLLRKKQSQFK